MWLQVGRLAAPNRLMRMFGVHVWEAVTFGWVSTYCVQMQPTSGAFVGTQPMLEPISNVFAVSAQMLVPMAVPAPLPPVLPALRGSAAEVELLANVELAEQRLMEFNIMYDEQRQKLLSEEQGALDSYRQVVGVLPDRPVVPPIEGNP